MVNRYSYSKTIADDSNSKTTTSAASHTSSGHLLHVSFRLAAPPSCSIFYYDWPAGNGAAAVDSHKYNNPEIVAAHGDCLLLEATSYDPDRWRDTTIIDYSLYDTSAAARPPALLLLPTCFIPMIFQRKRKKSDDDLDENLTPWYDDDLDNLDPTPSCLMKDNTGILRRGGDGGEVVVARLEVPRAAQRRKEELCVLDTGRRRLEWDLNREVPIFHGESTAGEAADVLMRWWETDAAVAVGGRFLCFVDYLRGFLLCDMAAADIDALELRYVPLPVDTPPDHYPDYPSRHPTARMSRNLAAAVRFVDVDDSGGEVMFVVTVWSLSLTTGGGDGSPPPATTWVKVAELDCEELWAMPGYGSLPCTGSLTYPVVSCDDADVVCFVMRNADSWYGMSREEMKVWMLEIDMRSKTLRSVVNCNTDEEQEQYKVAAQLKC